MWKEVSKDRAMTVKEAKKIMTHVYQPVCEVCRILYNVLYGVLYESILPCLWEYEDMRKLKCCVDEWRVCA